jgi:uncharacterized protein DUF3105
MMIRAAALLAVVLSCGLLAACGGSDGSTSTSTSTDAIETTSTTDSTATDSAESGQTTPIAGTETDSCSAAETVDVPMSGTHLDKDFTPDDYPTNPPAGGDHNPNPIQTGRFYDQPPRLGESVHALEHGAVIGWTNGLSAADLDVVHEAFNDSYSKGYFQLAVVENPDLDVPFALSSWGALQKCQAVDADAIASFIEAHYAPAATAEGALACTGRASRLPACVNREG